MNENLLWLIPSFFIIAFLYGSVGHGGASGYLALLSLFSVAPSLMGTSALILNCLVSGVAFITFFRAGYFSPRLTWPFIVASVPAALLGGIFPVSPSFFKILLSLTLFFAAFRLSLQMPRRQHISSPSIPLTVALSTGGGITLWLSRFFRVRHLWVWASVRCGDGTTLPSHPFYTPSGIYSSSGLPS